MPKPSVGDEVLGFLFGGASSVSSLFGGESGEQHAAAHSPARASRGVRTPGLGDQRARGLSLEESMTQYRRAVTAAEIDLSHVRQLAFLGVPEELHVRSIYWRVLLGYLPTTRAEWPAVKAAKLAEYQELVDRFYKRPTGKPPAALKQLKSSVVRRWWEQLEPSKAGGGDERRSVTSADEVLAEAEEEVISAEWQQFMADVELQEEIQRDVNRTHSGMHFFARMLAETEETTRQLLNRMLFVYAKLNPEVAYVQGMNELLAPLFYVVCSDAREKYDDILEKPSWEPEDGAPCLLFVCLPPPPSPLLPLFHAAAADLPCRYLIGSSPKKSPTGEGGAATTALTPERPRRMSGDTAIEAAAANGMLAKQFEVDAYFLFTAMVEPIQEWYATMSDQSALGVTQAMQKMHKFLETVDPRLLEHFEQIELKPEYYSLRWLTLFLAQDFPLPDVLRIWDSLFASPHRVDLLLNVCCAMLLRNRDALLCNGFEGCVELLQNLPPIDDVSTLIREAFELQLYRLGPEQTLASPYLNVQLPAPATLSLDPDKWPKMRLLNTTLCVLRDTVNIIQTHDEAGRRRNDGVTDGLDKDEDRVQVLGSSGPTAEFTWDDSMTDTVGVDLVRIHLVPTLLLVLRHLYRDSLMFEFIAQHPWLVLEGLRTDVWDSTQQAHRVQDPNALLNEGAQLLAHSVDRVVDVMSKHSVSGTTEVEGDLQWKALVCYMLNNKQLHLLPQAFSAGAAQPILAKRYEEQALVRWPEAMEQLSKILQPLSDIPFQLALNLGMSGASGPVYD